MFRTIAVAAALMLTTVTMVSAQGQGDARERAACRPDVMRFCKQLVKDNNDDVISILNCLQSNRPRISKACNQVLVSQGNEPFAERRAGTGRTRAAPASSWSMTYRKIGLHFSGMTLQRREKLCPLAPVAGRRRFHLQV